MSTILWDAHDLANVARFMLGPEGNRLPLSDPDSRVEINRVTESLHEYSKANCAAFKVCYEGRHGSDTAEPWSQTEIKAAILDTRTCDVKAAISCIRLLEYNLDDCGTVEALTLCTNALLHVVRHLENKLQGISELSGASYKGEP